MLSFLSLCLKKFGVKSGLLIYVHFKIFKSGKIFVPGLHHPIYFRPDSADIDTFREIFLREDYKVVVSDTKVIIDAGANIGFTSLYFARMYPLVTILSIEPDPQNFLYLKKNSAELSNIKPIQAALWHKKGTLEIYDKGYGVRGYMVEESQSKESLKFITSITIIDLIKKHNIQRIDILKIDIEGSEKEVFSDQADQWIPLTRCLIIELHDRMKAGCSQAVFKVMAKYNFDLSIKGENLIFKNRSFN
jgi:FkbM family methyltransferase